jgi:serine/threonine protein kinase
MTRNRNNGNNNEEPTSEFIKPEEVLKTDRFTDFSTVPGRGFSQLTRAKRNGRWWMLKELKEQYREDAVYQAFLQKEYEITSQLQHPMVVSVLSLEDVEGLGPCIVMEWIKGLTLKEWLAQGKHPRKQRRHVADMLTEALAYVHSRQTQHRDLKPSNIMLTQDGQHLKLIDFGLSDTDSHAILKAPAGTEGYTAPEGPSDIYSLGCVLRELRLGGASGFVIRKCCAQQSRRYTDVATVRRDLHRSWQWPLRILLTIALIIVMTALYLTKTDQTNAIINFVDKKVKAICVEHWDTNGDGELSRAEAAAVTELSDAFTNNKEITSFDELRYFTGLTDLYQWQWGYDGCSFNGCNALRSITIPANVTMLYGESFGSCTGLEKISVDPANTKYESPAGCNAIIEKATNRLVVGCETTHIPDGITTIGNNAFGGRWGMRQMDIPETVTTIEDKAFVWCVKLTNITLPASVKAIGNQAFGRCDTLISVRCYMETPPTITDSVFTNRTNATLYVPAGTTAAYKAADYWKEFKAIKEF